jgi:hypothetical protein
VCGTCGRIRATRKFQGENLKGRACNLVFMITRVGHICRKLFLTSRQIYCLTLRGKSPAVWRNAKNNPLIIFDIRKLLCDSRVMNIKSSSKSLHHHWQHAGRGYIAAVMASAMIASDLAHNCEQAVYMALTTGVRKPYMYKEQFTKTMADFMCIMNPNPDLQAIRNPPVKKIDNDPPASARRSSLDL